MDNNIPNIPSMNNVNIEPTEEQKQELRAIRLQDKHKELLDLRVEENIYTTEFEKYKNNEIKKLTFVTIPFEDPETSERTEEEIQIELVKKGEAFLNALENKIKQVEKEFHNIFDEFHSVRIKKLSYAELMAELITFNDKMYREVLKGEIKIRDEKNNLS
jgi:hypothetical protein